MSWVFGIIGDIANVNLQLIQQMHGNPIFKYQNSNLYIAAGGIKETCFYRNQSDSLQEGWLVSGIGIQHKNQSFHLMTQADWTDLFVHFSIKRLRELNGHFIIVKWKDGNIECFTDQLGLRSLYLTNLDNKYTLFSTRLDWVARINPHSDINYETFGSQWLLINDLSLESTVTNIKRLSQNGYAKCTSKSISFSNSPWLPDIAHDFLQMDHFRLLEELTIFPLRKKHKISLALSGGIDSRVLLSILLSSGLENWSIHSLHSPESPDNIISQRIAKIINVENTLYEDILPANDKIHSFLNDFVGITNAVFPISDSLGMEYYTKLYNQNKIIIDGGLGEIARRRYLNRLLLLGRKAFQRRDLDSIKSSFSMLRAPIFNMDTIELMNKGIYRQLNDLFENMPLINELSFEDWLDLLAIRTRFPNVAGFGQSFVDCYAINYMPYAQPSFLKKIFEMDVSERKDSKFFRRIIAKNKYLTKIPLVKDDVQYPYFLNTLFSSVYIKIKKRYRKSYNDTARNLLLYSIRNFVFDMINSTDFKNNECYDQKYIIDIVSNYYKGQQEKINEVIWFVTFELWRRKIKSKISPFIM